LRLLLYLNNNQIKLSSGLETKPTTVGLSQKINNKMLLIFKHGANVKNKISYSKKIL